MPHNSNADMINTETTKIIGMKHPLLNFASPTSEAPQVVQKRSLDEFLWPHLAHVILKIV